VRGSTNWMDDWKHQSYRACNFPASPVRSTKKDATMAHNYTDVVVTIAGQVGTIKLNRPSSLNAFGGNLLPDLVAALRELDEHPDTVFTVLTGEGRFVRA
jgi:1,4-dihydroxy-2-naphthoyl-CoA synthase